MRRRLATAASPIAPFRMPMLVMPTWTLERNRVGSEPSVNACRAPRFPASAICVRRARLELMMAISDMANTPFSKIKLRRIRTSVSM